MKNLIVIIGIAVISLILLAPEIESAIPPTPAIQTINSNDTSYSTSGGSYIADSSDDQLWIITDGSILIEFINYTGGPQ